MSRVTVDIDSRTLGEVTIRLEYPIESFDADAERRQIDKLLTEALDRARRAYEITRARDYLDQMTREATADGPTGDGFEATR